jgi:hypothetical protein
MSAYNDGFGGGNSSASGVVGGLGGSNTTTYDAFPASIVTDHGIIRGDEIPTAASTSHHDQSTLFSNLTMNEERVLIWLLKNGHSPQGLNPQLLKHLAREHRISESSGVGSGIDNQSLQEDNIDGLSFVQGL